MLSAIIISTVLGSCALVLAAFALWWFIRWMKRKMRKQNATAPLDSTGIDNVKPTESNASVGDC